MSQGMNNARNYRINGDRLWDSLMEMAKIGPGIAGGNNRQTLTDADAESRALFQRWCEDEGLVMGVDRMGTMYMRREGSDPSLPPVCVGSHLDTQPTGGKYDGVLGVLAGLEVIRTINELGLKTKHPIMVINWTNEEGARFAPAMMASGVFAGIQSLEDAYATTDKDGKSVADELKRIGWMGEEEVGAREMKAFYELHIEQGPILEAEGIDIGIVTHGQGLIWLEITMTGKESHTGTTPMPLRRNAGLGMARVTQLLDEIAWSHQPNAVGAIGHAEVYPNSRNIIPGQAVFTCDMRSPDIAILQDMETRVRAGAEAIAEELGLEVSFRRAGGFDPVLFDEGCVGKLRGAAERLGYSHKNIVSGAGHDACWINRKVPTAMVMCPCVDGLSHNEAEEIHPEWARAGTDVLLHAILDEAEVVS